jgi:hypothetical protein
MPTYKETIEVTVVLMRNHTYTILVNILLSRLTAYVEELNEDQTVNFGVRDQLVIRYSAIVRY